MVKAAATEKKVRVEPDEHGVSQAVRNSSLAALLDTPMPKSAMHLRARAVGRFDHAFCGEDTQWLTDADDCVDCEDCKAEVQKRRAKAERAALKTLAKGPISIRRVQSDTRHRLEKAGLAATRGAGFFITDAGRARLQGGT